LAEERELLEEQQLAALEARKKAREKGDGPPLIASLKELQIGPTPATTLPPWGDVVSNDAKLPEPERPKKYTALSLAQFQDWVRDIDNFIVRAPRRLGTDADQVAFARTYLGDTLQRDWDSLVKDTVREQPRYQPTWPVLQEYAKLKLGPLHLLRQEAFNAMKKLRQEDGTPLELLNKFRPLWAELNLSDEDTRVLWFNSALTEEVYNKVIFEHKEGAKDVQEAEDRATRAHRQRRGNKGSTGEAPKGPKGDRSKKRSREDKDSGNVPDESHPPKKPKRGKEEGSGGPKAGRRKKSLKPKRSKEEQEKLDKWRAERKCLNCGSGEHFVANCPTRGKKSGKEKATTSGTGT